MKSLTKCFGTIAIVISLAFLLIIGAIMVNDVATFAEEGTDKYFYSRISYDSRAEKFYKAFETLATSGEFKKGKIEVNLTQQGVVNPIDVTNYVDSGDTQMVRAYGKGRDSFIMDHPDLFYVDLFGTSISAGMMGQNYTAYLDSSRVLNLYNGEFNSQEKVNEAISTYESKLSQIVTQAQQIEGVKEQITFVNNYLVENVEYSFGTEVIDGKNVDTPDAAYISTAYGSIVNGKAICGGYAKGFKAVMDRLNIPCVCVQGYSKSSTSESFVAHMWNYVEIDSVWYAVDVTWNDSSMQHDKWLLVGGNTLFETHVEDPVISSSNFELSYPAVNPYDFGDNTDKNGMTVNGSYSDSESSGKILTLEVSFDGKGAVELKKENKYMIFRMGYTDKNGIKWLSWYDVLDYGIVYSTPFNDKGELLTCYLHAGIEYIQFAVVDYAPDDDAPDGMHHAFYPNEDKYGENAGKPCYYAYKPENLTEDHFVVEPSSSFRNNGYGSYLPAPGAVSITPSNTAELPVDDTYEMKFVYNDKLELAEGKTLSDVSMGFTTSRDSDLAQKEAIISNFNWDGDKTVTFTFTPSKMYIHYFATYYFIPNALVGETSKKVPDPVSYIFQGKNVVCSKVFNDGRLYMNVFGHPQILDNSDISVTDFKDENGNYFAASQRSQLMLVASKPTSSQQETMDEVLKQETNIQEEDVISSTSYEISLNICGVVRQVPNGSYMQVAFGFPEGYDPNDAGTTFKIYHYKHDNHGNITGVEEIPVIITEYGIIAKVNSFSPFTIVQLKNTSAAVTESNVKNIYAYVNGDVGGTITTEGKGGIAEVNNDNIVYDITAESGYKVGYVKLNGKVLDASNFADGKLTLNKSDIQSSNTLEVAFVTEESANSYSEKGMNVYYGETSDFGTTKNDSNALTIALAVVIPVVLIAGLAVILLVLKKKKSN